MMRFLTCYIYLLCASAIWSSCAQDIEEVTVRQNTSVDLTEVPGENGRHVVRAVLSRINQSRAFDSSQQSWQRIHAFMRRLAYVVTRDGQDGSNHPGGIWNVSKYIFNQTQSSTYAENVYNNILEHFGFNWSTAVHYSNLSKPLFSGLAIRIYLHHIEENPSHPSQNEVPEKNTQGGYWADNFFNPPPVDLERPPVIVQWNRRIKELDGNETCRVNTSVVFVLDASGSIGRDNFDKVRNFVYNFTNALIKDDNSDNRIGVVLYSNNATVEIALNSTLNEKWNNRKNYLLSNISSLPYRGGYTNTPEGICKMATQDWGRGLILRLGVVLTDGQANRNAKDCDNLTHAVEKAKNQSILLYALGVGPNVVNRELFTIASNNHTVDHVDNFISPKLGQFQEDTAYEICYLTSTSVTVGEKNSALISVGESITLRFDLALESGITIRICIMQGEVLIYVSRQPSPSEAQHDVNLRVHALDHSISCLTTFFHFATQDAERRKRSEPELGTLYLSIVGIEKKNEFSLNSSAGKVIFDENECENALYPCSNNANCTNTDGSFFCTCHSGFAGDGINCTDINECEDDPPPCPKHERCVNTVGGFSCSVNGQVAALSVGFTIGPVIAIGVVAAIAACLCYSKKKAKGGGEEPESDDDSLVKVGGENQEEDEDDWNYTMTITWQQEEDKKKDTGP